MANLTDVLTSAQNIVTAINGVGQIIARGQGNITSATVTADTLITTGNGYLVSVSVTVPGSTEGYIYNALTVATAAADNALMAINPPDGIGIVPAGIPYNLGLVVSPGTGQSLNVVYYQK